MSRAVQREARRGTASQFSGQSPFAAIGQTALLVSVPPYLPLPQLPKAFKSAHSFTILVFSFSSP